MCKHFLPFLTDGNHVLEEEYTPMLSKEPVGFDELLKQAKQKLKNK